MYARGNITIKCILLTFYRLSNAYYSHSIAASRYVTCVNSSVSNLSSQDCSFVNERSKCNSQKAAVTQLRAGQ